VSGVVSFELRGDLALVRLDDGKANAMSAALVAGVEAALERATKEAKAVVLFGRPGRFSAGFDLKVMMSGPEAARSLVMAGGELLMKLYEHPQPLVIAVTGHAIAGGVLMAATGDRRIGVLGDFKLGLNEVANGMPVPILAHELARDRLDPRVLVESVLHAKMWDPEGAVRAGWLDRVVPADELEAAAIAEAEALAKLPQPAYAQTKRSLRRQTIRYVRESMAANLAEFSVG
jgi:enoyl-CoA hydratase